MRKNYKKQMIFLTEAALLPIISKRIQVIGREEELTVNQVTPVWQAIALGGLLKLVKNRIRYNALMNFLKLKVDPSHIELLQSDFKGSDELINSYGESLIGILFPDKKSALAIGLSQKMKCKSSFFIKGLTYFLGVLVLELKKEESELNQFTSFCDYFLSFKAAFSELVSTDLQKSIIEILLLNDVLKSDFSLIYADTFEETEESKQNGLKNLLNRKNISIACGILFLVGLTFYLTVIRSDNTVVIEESEEIIPLDSLNKLNDSLTQVAVDSTKLLADSTVSLSWTAGKSFAVPKQSALVTLHTFLTDSTAKDPLVLTCYEISFDNETDQLAHAKDYFLKRFTEGLQVYKEAKIEIISFSEKDAKSAQKRGFYLKNRLVGEGLSPKRISVLPNSVGINPDASLPLHAQVVFKVLK